VIFVPIHESRVRVSGAVLRPAVYETKAGETLADVIRPRGGFRPDAALERVKVMRILPAARGHANDARIAIDVPMPQGAGARSRFPGQLRTATSCWWIRWRVPPSSTTVAITGMVQQPDVSVASGDHVAPGHGARRGPRIGVDLREAEIARLPADRSKGQLATTLRVPLDSTYFVRARFGHAIGPAGRPLPCGWDRGEVPLEPYDNVLIFASRLQLRHSHDYRRSLVSGYLRAACQGRPSNPIFWSGRRADGARVSGDSVRAAADDRGRINIIAKSTRYHDFETKSSCNRYSVRIPEYQRVSAFGRGELRRKRALPTGSGLSTTYPLPVVHRSRTRVR